MGGRKDTWTSCSTVSRARRWRRSVSSCRIPRSLPSSATSATLGATSRASCSPPKSKHAGNKGITMSSVVDTHDHGHGHGHDHAHDHDDHGHHGGYGGFMRWVTTTNHKDIGTMYLWFAGFMFFVGGMMA